MSLTKTEKLIKAFPFPFLSVMVIDDVMSTRRVLKRILMGLGMHSQNIYESPGLYEGLEIWDQIQVDIVFCDYKLSNVTGLDVIEKFSQSQKSERANYVIISNDLDNKAMRLIREAGVSHIIMKPLSTDLVENVILEICSQSKFFK
jgi:CheY-like chemotaxis protein